MSNDSRSILVVGIAALVLLCGSLGAVLAVVNSGDVSNTPVEDDTMMKYESTMEKGLVAETVAQEPIAEVNQLVLNEEYNLDKLTAGFKVLNEYNVMGYSNS